MSSELCDRCEKPANWYCNNCDVPYCTECKTDVHKKGKWQQHELEELQPEQLCDRCEKPANWYCNNCDVPYCTECKMEVHKKGKWQQHEISSLSETGKKKPEKPPPQPPVSVLSTSNNSSGALPTNAPSTNSSPSNSVGTGSVEKIVGSPRAVPPPQPRPVPGPNRNTIGGLQTELKNIKPTIKPSEVKIGSPLLKIPMKPTGGVGPMLSRPKSTTTGKPVDVQASPLESPKPVEPTPAQTPKPMTSITNTPIIDESSKKDKKGKLDNSGSSASLKTQMSPEEIQAYKERARKKYEESQRLEQEARKLERGESVNSDNDSKQMSSTKTSLLNSLDKSSSSANEKKEKDEQIYLKKTPDPDKTWYNAPDKVGFLKCEVSGVFGKKWQERYIVLKYNQLYIFEDAKKTSSATTKPIRQFKLDWSQVEVLRSGKEPQLIVFFSPYDNEEREQIFQARDDREMYDWIVSIRRQKYQYSANEFGVDLSTLKEKKDNEYTNPSHQKVLEKFQSYLTDNQTDVAPLTESTSLPVIEIEPDSELNLVLADNDETAKFSIKHATVGKLIEKLTDIKLTNTPYIEAFLLTFHSFTTPSELLATLIHLWKENVPENKEELSVLPPILTRVIQVLKKWIDTNFFDFLDSPHLTTQLLNFLESNLIGTDVRQFKTSGEGIKNSVNRKLKPQTYENVQLQNAPEPILPSGFEAGCFDLIDLHPLEIARQIAIYEFNLFKAVPPRELLGQKWLKPNKLEIAPRLSTFIQSFNILSYWVVNTIVNTEDTIARGAIMGKFIEIAGHLLELNAFDCMVAIISGLENASIFRLKHAWNEVAEEDKLVKEKCKAVMNTKHSYKEYRTALHGTTSATIPYFGVHLQDLTFIEDGSKDEVNGLTNFKKRALISRVIQEIKQFQQSSYILQPVPELQDYLLSIKTISDKDAYDKSLLVEPRSLGDPVAKTKKKLPPRIAPPSNNSTAAKRSSQGSVDSPRPPPQSADRGSKRHTTNFTNPAFASSAPDLNSTVASPPSPTNSDKTGRKEKRKSLLGIKSVTPPKQ